MLFRGPGTDRDWVEREEVAVTGVGPAGRRRERRPEAERRGERLHLRLGVDEKRLIEGAAAEEGMAPAAWAARAALAVAAGAVVPVETDAAGALRELMEARRQLRRIGNNLNQVARSLNAEVEVPGAQLAAVMAAVDAAVRRVDAATVQVMRERRPR